MKKYETNRLRNIALIAHGKAGKTTLAEAMLFDAGVSDRLGRVDDGTSVMDFEPEEIKRSLTISSSFNHLEWDKTQDQHRSTPRGTPTSSSTPRTASRPWTGPSWSWTPSPAWKCRPKKSGSTPTSSIFPGSSSSPKWTGSGPTSPTALADIQKVLTPKAIPLNLPIGAEDSFTGVVDLLSGKAYHFESNLSGKFTEGEIPADLKEEAKSAREKLIEVIAESDDALLEKYLEGQELSPEELTQGLRKGVLNKTHLPGSLRVGIEEYGHSAPSGRHHPVPAFSPGPRARQRHQPGDQGGGNPRSRRKRSPSRPLSSRPWPIPMPGN